MFVRFVVGGDDENAWWLTGVIASARVLRDEGELHDYESELVEAIFDWFNQHLPCPPFEQKLRSGEWTREAVAWFRNDAKAMIARIWDLVAILREHDTQVRMITTEKPGKIVYRDAYQIVAETPYWA